jgi:predicted Zn-dependent protease
MTLGFSDEQGVGVHVLTDDEQGFGVTADIQSAPLANREEMSAGMGADFEGLSQIKFRWRPWRLSLDHPSAGSLMMGPC